MLKLFYSPGACSLAAHIALRESGLSFDLEKVDLASRRTASGGDYLSINSKGYVPALQFADGSAATHERHMPVREAGGGPAGDEIVVGMPTSALPP